MEKVLKYSHMDKYYPLSFIVILHSLQVKKNIFHPKEKNEVFGLELSYFNTVDTLMYFAIYTY